MIAFWFWLGLVLCLLEMGIPGAVLIFLGLGALTVAGLIYIGWVDTWLMAFGLFFTLSLVYLLVLRSLLMKLIPGEEVKENTDEEQDAAGSIVTVVEAITPESPGRIKYLDSTWRAYGDEKFETGEQVVLVAKKKIGWTVKPLE